MTDTVAAATSSVRRRSYSALTTYMECPEKYRHKYVLRVPEEPAVWSAGGTAFHTCAETYLRGDAKGPLFDVERAWALAWDDAVDEVVRRNPGADPSPDHWRAANKGHETAEWWSYQGPAMVRRFIAWWDERAAKGQLTVLDGGFWGPWLEQRLETELGGVPLVAIPDAVVVDEHGQVCILDYKSGKEPKSSLQLGVYRAAILAATGMESTWGLYYMTRKGEALAKDLTAWTPEYITDLFVRFDARETAGDYTPTPGDACRFCPFRRTTCRYYNPEST